MRRRGHGGHLLTVRSRWWHRSHMATLQVTGSVGDREGAGRVGRHGTMGVTRSEGT
ncbi:hypothetical protein ACFPM0_14390 [Pseudonocardia sulfidoxydans]|uniref:hypothetical protein n=1 Tax=Pseudonocardia sulfidoxydans TaxID=54011 RepID=UPI00360F81BA